MKAFPLVGDFPLSWGGTLCTCVSEGNRAAAHVDPDLLQLIGNTDC